MKQENALKTVELRDKINKLQTENNLLNGMKLKILILIDIIIIHLKNNLKTK